MNPFGGGSGAAAEWRSHWILPIVAALGYASSVLHIYGIGPFMGAITQEFGWSRTQVSAGLTLSSLVSGALCIPIGLLVDRIGPRRVGLVGVAAITAAFALLSTTTGSLANWLFLWSVIAIGTLGVQATVWTSAVASRFSQSRGLAFAVTLAGASVAATVFPVLATWLIEAFGWRTAFMAMAGIWAALVVPLLALFFRGARDDKAGAAPISPPAAPPTPDLPTVRDVGLADALKMPALYKLLLASALFTFSAIAIVVHFVPILKDFGAAPMAAAGIASLVGIFSIIGRLGTGLLLDRYPAHLIGAGVFVLPILASGLLVLDGASPVNQSIAAAVFGLTVGAEVDVIAFLSARHFGLKSFGALYGAMLMALSAGTAFGPLAAGAVFDRHGGYEPFLMLTMFLLGAASLTLASLGRPPAAMQAVAPAIPETTPSSS